MYHIDPESLRVVLCEAPYRALCEKVAAKAHYASREEALEALAFSKALEDFTGYSPVVNFHRVYSGKTESYFLEANLKNPFNEDVCFTVESHETCSLGSMFLGGNEHLLARREHFSEPCDLEELAKATVQEAKRLHRLELWPSKFTVELYRAFSAKPDVNSITSKHLSLTAELRDGLSEVYRGETLRGTEVAIKATCGYAIAIAERQDDFELLYEANLSRGTFRSLNERNAFAAKAFGELLELGEL